MCTREEIERMLDDEYARYQGDRFVTMGIELAETYGNDIDEISRIIAGMYLCSRREVKARLEFLTRGFKAPLPDAVALTLKSMEAREQSGFTRLKNILKYILSTI